MNIYLVSLGCAKNLVDSEEVLGALSEHGYALTLDQVTADVFLINTCGFLAAAREEGYAVIKEAIAWKTQTQGTIAVIGCQAQKEADTLRECFPGVDVISGFGGYAELPAALKNASAGETTLRPATNDFQVPRATTPLRLTGGATAYMKLGEGCSKRCAFCAIPHIRGNQISVPLDDLRSRATQLAAGGVRELVLIAQDPVTYGQDFTDADSDLLAAIDVLESDDGIDWLRLHYLFPGKVARRIGERMISGGKLLPYLDMPLQHAHPDILRAMRRPALDDTGEFLLNLRERCPTITLRTTFIVGYPGERDEHFAALLDFIRAVEFDRVGVFTYSAEAGTPAADLPGHVADSEKENRAVALMALAQEISAQRQQTLIGQIVDAIVDFSPTNSDDPTIARTIGQSPEVDGVTYIESPGLSLGAIVPVQISDATDFDLYARIADGGAIRPMRPRKAKGGLPILPS